MGKYDEFGGNSPVFWSIPAHPPASQELRPPSFRFARALLLALCAALLPFQEVGFASTPVPFNPGPPLSGANLLLPPKLAKKLNTGALTIPKGTSKFPSNLSASSTLKVAPVSSFGFLPSAAVHVKSSASPTGFSAQSIPTNSIILDSSLGQTGQPAITTNGNGANDYGIAASLGKQLGGNLFFSFSQFGLATGESATFSGPGSVQNILARVTGGNASSIDGTIHSTISGANLYLINPAGIIFGPNAQLDISGAVVISTADYLKLADNARFDSAPGANDSTLSASAVTSFGFVSAKPGAISLNESTLTGATGGKLLFVGGDIALNQASITTPSGYIGLWSTNGPGEITAADGAGTRAGNVTLSQARIETTGSPGGSISIRGGTLEVDNSVVYSETQGPTNGGNVELSFSGAVDLTDFARVATFTSSSGNAGNVSLRAGSLSLSANSVLGSQALSDATIDAHSGEVNVITPGYISIASESSIASFTYGPAAGSKVQVQAGTISIIGDSSPIETGIFSTTYANGSGGGGAGGDVLVHTGELQILSGGAIAADTFGYAPAGDVTVNANKIKIAARGATLKTGIFSDSLSTGDGGRGGTVRVAADSLQITDGGLISTKTLGLGRGGDTDIEVGDLFISRGDSSFYTGIAADTALPGLRGAGGDISVTADRLRVVDGGQISANTFGLGPGGNIRINAGEVEIVGRPDLFTGISAESASTTEGAKGGNIELFADTLRITDGGRISANTFGSGAGGDVKVAAQDITLSAKDNLQFTGIAATSAGSGNGGSVTVDAHDLALAHSTISASAPNSDAGSVLLNIEGSLTLNKSSGITTSAGRNGGNIEVKTKQTVYLLDSAITATAGSARTTSSDLGGQGGNITIDPQFVVLNNSVISANAAIGRGGNIKIVSDYFLQSASAITATGAQQGTVVISAPELDLNGGLIGLTAALVDVSTRLQERCAMALQGDFSSFISLGRGGVAQDPEEQQLSLPPELK